MTQGGYVFKKGPTWFLRYRYSVNVNGKIVRKQKAVPLADVCDRYRTKRDLRDLVAEKLASVQMADKCPRSSDSFIEYVEELHLPASKPRKAPTF